MGRSFKLASSSAPTWGMRRQREAEARIDNAFPFRAATFGNVTVALAPDRGRSADRRADYHDPTLPPRHALIAFGLWLRKALGCPRARPCRRARHAGMAAGQDRGAERDCFPEIVTGSLPVVYPFIVSNPGEAAQAKRRIAAVTLGHLPPPLAAAGLDENQQKLERLVDEYAQADGLDRRRRDRLAKLIVETAAKTGLAARSRRRRHRRARRGAAPHRRLALRPQGFRHQGRAAHLRPRRRRTKPTRCARKAPRPSATALIAALDGRHVTAGPSGAPARGRTDVLPTGRNLFTADPRTMPTPTAFDLGQAAADEVLRRYLQDHGDWPRSLVDRPLGHRLAAHRRRGDRAGAGADGLPPAMGRRDRPRHRHRGAAAGGARPPARRRHLAHLRPVPRHVPDPDRADRRGGQGRRRARRGCFAKTRSPRPRARDGKAPARIFGSSPGTYGAGLEDLLASGDWAGARRTRPRLSRRRLACLWRRRGRRQFPRPAPSPTASPTPTCWSIPATIPAATFSKARPTSPSSAAFRRRWRARRQGRRHRARHHRSARSRGRARSPRRSTRVVRARATNPRFIEGQMRHGPRGASEFAETVDRLIGFAETTNAIPGALIEAVHDAYLGDEKVRAFMLRENPAAAAFIAERFAAARRRGLWHPLRNSVDDDLAALIAEAQRAGRWRHDRAGGKRPLAGGFTRRGACPALSAPMQTGDGLLVRLNPVAGGLSPKQLDRALRSGGAARQRRRRGDGARQPADTRPDRSVRGTLRRERRCARHRGAHRRAGGDRRAGRARSGRDRRSDRACRDASAPASQRPGWKRGSGRKCRSSSTAAAGLALDEVAADVRLTAVESGGSPRGWWRLPAMRGRQGRWACAMATRQPARRRWRCCPRSPRWGARRVRGI